MSDLQTLRKIREQANLNAAKAVAEPLSYDAIPANLTAIWAVLGGLADIVERNLKSQMEK